MKSTVLKLPVYGLKNSTGTSVPYSTSPLCWTKTTLLSLLPLLFLSFLPFEKDKVPGEALSIVKTARSSTGRGSAGERIGTPK